jgi:CheY-like chemotaxis protein
MPLKSDNSDKTHIMAVDDSLDNLSLIELILDNPTYDVEVASSGQEALSKIAQRVPDLILLDVMMPGMDGFEVTRRIREDDSIPYVPILLITAHDPRKIANRTEEVEVEGLIRKPLDIDELQDRVAKLTQNTRQHEYSNVQDLPSA